MARPLSIKGALPQRSQVSGCWVFVHPVIWLFPRTNSSWLWPWPCLTSVYLLFKTKRRQDSWMKTFLNSLSISNQVMTPLLPQPLSFCEPSQSTTRRFALLCHPSGLKSSKARIFSCLSVYIHNRSGREWSIERILYMFVDSQFCWQHLCDSDN